MLQLLVIIICRNCLLHIRGGVGSSLNTLEKRLPFSVSRHYKEGRAVERVSLLDTVSLVGRRECLTHPTTSYDMCRGLARGGVDSSEKK